MPTASTGLHWFTFTTDHSVNDVMERLGGGWAPVEPLGGYGHPRSICHESGARVYFGSERQDQPVCVNLTGEVCEEWSGEGVSWAEDLAAVVTRSDFATDLHPAEEARGRMLEMRRAWKSGRVETRIRTFQEHRSDDGWTWYFGGKSADLRLRCYDKRGPLRLEFQWRPDREQGSRVAEVIARRGVATCWRSLARTISFPMKWWRDLVDGDAVTLEPATAEESSLLKVLEQLQLQLGASLWALELLGLKLSDLTTPPENLRGDVAAKFLRWAREGEAEGYHGEALRREVQCRLKSRRNSK
jgi:hypothetical protein